MRILLLLAAISVAAQNQTITVTADTLAGLPRVKVEAKEHDNPTATYEGVLLGSILERAGVPRGEKLRGKALRTIVVITATDGYEVIFTLPDTDPAFTDRLIVLADTKDGKPLPEKEGPFRIVVPAEKRPARWIRNVRTIAIKNVE